MFFVPVLVSALGAAAFNAEEVREVATDLMLRSTTVGYLPRGLTSFGAVVEGGWLYVLGGYFGTPHEYSIEGQSSAFLKVNLLDTRDTRLLEDVEPVQGAELVSWKSRLICVGGLHARNTKDEPTHLESSARVAWFDIDAEAWEELPDLPMTRSSHRAVVMGDELHVVGGWSLAGEAREARWASDHLILDLSNPDAGWQASEAPFQVRALGAAASGGHLYAVGGIQSDREISSACWVYSLEDRAWTEGPEFPEWGFGVSVTAFDGGVVASGRSGEVHRLLAPDGAWGVCGELGHGRIFHEIRQDSPTSLVALGGIAGMQVRGRMRAIERLEVAFASEAQELVDSDPWERIVIPAPGDARNRFALAVEGRSLYLFGGNTSLDQHAFGVENFSRQAWRLDLANLEWNRLADLPEGRQSMKALVDEKGTGPMVLGGFGFNGESATTRGSGWRYDTEFDEWLPGPEFEGTRSQFGLVAHGDTVWMVGGSEHDPSKPRSEASTHPTRIVKLDREGDADRFFDAGVEAPEGRRAFASELLGDVFYVVGGLGDGYQPIASAATFDLATKAWAAIASPEQPRVGGDLVEIEGELFLLGGSSPDADGNGLSPNPSVERYSPATGAWTTVVDDIGIETRHARAFAIDDTIFMISTHRAGTPRLEIISAPVERLIKRSQAL